jgi:hypothetical protein
LEVQRPPLHNRRIQSHPNFDSFLFHVSICIQGLSMKMGDDFLQGEIASLSDGQEIILSVLMICSGLLSILGSSTIVYRVAEKKTRTTPYDRIILGLSVCDIVASFSYIVTPFLLPQETSQRVWASGSDGSCSFLGWLTQFSFAAVAYNSLLS